MNSDNTLDFGDRRIVPNIRRLNDMKDVIYDVKWLKTAIDGNLYYMYRDLSTCKEDQVSMAENNLRYDITIIPPFNLGNEFVKTAGHYHPLIEGSGNTYPEVYEVLEGEAHYLIQKLENDAITDVVIVKAKKGDKVIIPPNYGHVTINPSNQILKMANWVSDGFSSIYAPYKNHGGAAYFELKNGKIIYNNSYNHIPEISHLKPVEIPEIGFERKEDMYDLIKEVKNLKFLNEPHDYGWLWELVLNK